jgi:2-polyprenyl-3-methyl-5-hydroxy-6-metoxy-1,4-benzoquinol methylase
MENSKNINASCPVCHNEETQIAINCKDYSLTKESFDIIHCSKCSFRFTNPMPGKEQISPYYNFTEYISHTDIKDGWMNKLYHKVRQHTLLQKTNWVQSLFTGHKGNLLEIGAGTGAFAHAMVQKGWNVTALEPDEASRKRALDNYKLSLLPTDALYSLPRNHFDVITLWHVLEHVHDLNEYILAFKSILKANGRLIIAVPNYTSFDAKYYKEYWAAYDVPRHLYHFSPKSMDTLCYNSQFKVVQYKPMWFDSFYVSLLSEKYMQSGILGILRAFVIGCISNINALKDNNKASSVVYEIKNIN